MRVDIVKNVCLVYYKDCGGWKKALWS